MLSDKLFLELIESASLAASADNMQPWEFRKRDNKIEVFLAKQRMLPTDILGMFGWMGLGAAVQNLVVKSEAYGFTAVVEYTETNVSDFPAAIIEILPGNKNNRLAEFITRRSTNRNPYHTLPLESSLVTRLTGSIAGMDAGISWLTSTYGYECMASMDANSSYIRLEHQPFHDELFDILRFSCKEIETTRYGLTFESLEVPSIAVFIARQLQYWSVNSVVSKLGIGRIVAKQLADKLKKTGAICLITSRNRNPLAYIEAGRTMEQLWLTATAEGLSVQPYGVLPQYITRLEIEPDTFLPQHAAKITSHREKFTTLFPQTKIEYPAIVLRIGHADKQSARSDIRLRVDQIIRKG